jgi:hypothetical protein
VRKPEIAPAITEMASIGMNVSEVSSLGKAIAQRTTNTTIPTIVPNKRLRVFTLSDIANQLVGKRNLLGVITAVRGCSR